MSNANVGVEPKVPSGLSAPFASSDKRSLVLCLLLAALTLVVYNRANHCGFINYDDPVYVSQNSHVRAGLTWATLKWAFTSTEHDNWHPLTWISHALDYQLFHLNPAGHHFTSVLLHALNVVLLFLLLVRSTRRFALSFFAAALFALHPLNVESVVWIAERKNLLSTTFFLLTLGAYGWYAFKPGWKRYLAVAGLLACGLASKPMLVTTPFVLLLLDYWPLGRITKWTRTSNTLAVKQSSATWLLIEKLPLLLMVVASSAVTLYAQRSGGAFGLSTYPLADRFKNAIYSYVAYLGKAVWPVHLTLFYPYDDALARWKVSLAALFLIVTSYVIWGLRSRGYLVTGWLWFLGTLIPVIGVVQVGGQSMADRYTYIPLIGIFVMVTWLAAEWLEKNSVRWPNYVVPAVLLLSFSFATYKQIGYWNDSVSVWTHALQVTQHNWSAENNLGEALVKLDRADDAYPYFLQSAREAPGNPAARLNIGAYLRAHGQDDAALAEFKLALRLAAEPNMRAGAYANLGELYLHRGDYADSQSSYEQALRLDPDRVNSLRGMAFLLQTQGRWAEAVPYFDLVVKLEPSARGYLELAKALDKANHPAEAMVALRHAVQEEPSLASVPALRALAQQP
jgi:protein O-mannosyl-transferase